MTTSIDNNGSARGVYASSLAASAFTLRFWIKWSPGADGVVFGTNSANPYTVSYIDGGDGLFYYYGVQTSYSWVPVTNTNLDSTWVHIAVTYDGTTWRWFWRRDTDGSYTTGPTQASAGGGLPALSWLFDPSFGTTPPDKVSFQNIRVSSVDLNTTDLMADSTSNTAVDAGTTLEGEWANGPSPGVSTWQNDTSGNSRNMTPSGTATVDNTTPVTGGGGGSTVTAELGTAGVSTTAFAASVTRTAGMGSAGVGVTAFTGSKLATVAMGSAGVGATNPIARATRTVAAQTNGVGSTTFAGKRTLGVASQSDGVGATAFAGKRSLRAALSVAGEAVTAFVGRALKPGGWSSDGVGTTSFDGQTSAVSGAEFDSDGVSTTAFAARVTRAAALASGGTVTVGLAVRVQRRGVYPSIGVGTTAATARATRTTAMVSDGVSTTSVTGRRTVRAALGTAGAATVSYFGRTANAATIAFASAGVALVGFAGRVTRRGATQSDGVSTTTATGRARMRGTLATAGASLVSFAGRARVVGGWASAGASLVAFTADAIAATYATIWRLVPPVKRYRLVPPREVYCVSSSTKWFPAFDPDARDYLELDLTEITLAKGSPIASATVTEVDTNDNPVGTPVLDLETPIVVTGTRVLVMAETHDGAPTDTVCRLRFEYTHADTRRDHFTAFLPVKHQ